VTVAVGAGVAAGFGVAAGAVFLAAGAFGFVFSLGFSFFAGATGVGMPGGGSSWVCAMPLAGRISKLAKKIAKFDRARRIFISGVIPVRL
jgi:hypothetical protein